MTLAYRPLLEVPPPCNIPTRAGWCVLPEQHTGSHVPIPATYPPTPTETSAGMSGGEPLIPAEHHPEWDGNRCSNCNARLSEAGPYCPMADEPDWLTAEMNRQRRAGIPNLDNVSDGSRPDWDGCRTCMGTGIVDDGDRLCPECKGRGEL